MKTKTRFLSTCLISLLTSCASHPITLAPVGPSPFAGAFSANGTGRLEVFSRLSQESDNQNQGDNGGDPIWYQHTDYSVYNTKGKRVKYVDNTTGQISLNQAKPSEITSGQHTYSGIVVQAIKAKRPLQLLNPGAPSDYGSGWDNIEAFPASVDGPTLKVFSISF